MGYIQLTYSYNVYHKYWYEPIHNDSIILSVQALLLKFCPNPKAGNEYQWSEATRHLIILMDIFIILKSFSAMITNIETLHQLKNWINFVSIDSLLWKLSHNKHMSSLCSIRNFVVKCDIDLFRNGVMNFQLCMYISDLGCTFTSQQWRKYPELE